MVYRVTKLNLVYEKFIEVGMQTIYAGNANSVE